MIVCPERRHTTVVRSNRVAPGSSPIKVGLISCDSTKTVVGESPLAQALASGDPRRLPGTPKVSKSKNAEALLQQTASSRSGFPKLLMGAQNVA
jgi:hypothetical protein